MIVVILTGLMLIITGEQIILIAQEDLNIYDKPMNGKVIGILHSNEKISVIGCEDLKHYIIPIVNYSNRKAYIIEGGFHLERRKLRDFEAGLSLSFSCQ